MSEKKFVFIEGSPVHYPDFGDFAVCGMFWLNASTTPSYVTCEECKKRMVDSGIHIPEETEEECGNCGGSGKDILGSPDPFGGCDCATCEGRGVIVS